MMAKTTANSANLLEAEKNVEYKKADKLFEDSNSISDTASRCPKVIHSRIAFWTKKSNDNIIVEINSKLTESQRNIYYLNKKFNK